MIIKFKFLFYSGIFQIGGELAAFGDTEVKAAPVAEDKSKQKTPKLGKVVVSKSRSPSAKGKDKKGAAKVEEPPAPGEYF